MSTDIENIQLLIGQWHELVVRDTDWSKVRGILDWD